MTQKTKPLMLTYKQKSRLPLGFWF